MDITSMEVIRCPGVAITVVTGEKVELTYGDTLKVNVSFDYRGLAGSATLYGAIGTRGWAGFNEILHGEVSIDLSESRTDFSRCERSVKIPITSDIKPGTDYDLYVKIKEYKEAGAPEVSDCIDIVGIPPTYELLEETIHPYAYVYDGPCNVSTFTFKTDPFTPAKWIAGKLATAVETEVKKAGGRVIEMRVYVDRSPLLWTDWQIEVVGVPASTAGLGVSVGIAWWAVAILAALAIILIIVITWAIKTIADTFKHKPLSEEIKAAWSKETLISAINDFEEKLDRTPTPPEELEKKSDKELRDYCNELAQEIVPPGVSWWPIAIGAGVVVVGIGVAMATRRTTHARAEYGAPSR